MSTTDSKEAADRLRERFAAYADILANPDPTPDALRDTLRRVLANADVIMRVEECRLDFSDPEAWAQAERTKGVKA